MVRLSVGYGSCVRSNLLDMTLFDEESSGAQVAVICFSQTCAAAALKESLLFRSLRDICSIFTLFISLVFSPNLLRAQMPAAAPVPAGIFTAKTIFVANAGEDEFVDAGEGAAVPQGTYDRVHSAIAAWGRYTVVTSPAKADLVLEVRSRLVEEGHGAALFEARRIDYRLLDGPTRAVLWGGSIHVQRAARQRTLDKNLSDAVDFLVRDLKLLVNRAATAPV